MINCGPDLEVKMGLKEIHRGFWERKKQRCFGEKRFWECSMAVDLHPSPRRNSVSCRSSRLKSDSQPCSGLVFLGTSHAETLTENCCQSLHPSFSLSPFPLFPHCLLLTHLRFSHSFERNSIPSTLSPGFFLLCVCVDVTWSVLTLHTF